MGDIDKVKETLTKGKKRNLTSSIANAQDYKGYSAVHLAIPNNHEDIVNELLSLNVDVNTSLNEKSNMENSKKDGFTYSGITEGRTPLMDASINGHLSLVRKLVGRHANIDALDKLKYNAVIFAAQEGQKNVMKYLLENKPVLAEFKGFQSRTALGIAAMCGRLNVVEELIQNWKVDIDIPDKFHSTPINLAAEYNHLSVVDYLLQKGANASIKDEEGKDAIDWAREKGHQEIINLIKNHLIESFD